jgi:hypothetical protein
MEKETENKINFLDITIQKEEHKFSFKIYRKPTTTDSITPSDSYHPQEHKHAAIRHMINRMNTYNLNKDDKDNEKNTTEHIVNNNNKYSTTITNKLGKQRNNKKHPPGTKWAKFIYIGKENKFITKLFKDTSVNVTFTTKQTIKTCKP